LHIYIWIVILVLFLVAVVGAYFASRTWHWAHVLVAVGIFLAAIGYFVLAAETLRINAILRSQANATQQELDQVTAKIEALRAGTRDAQVINQLAADEVQVPEAADQIPSIADLEHRLHMQTRIRGKVWRRVAPAGFDPQRAALRVAVESPQPSGIEPDTILFVFEEGAPTLPDPTRGPQYLGEFRVVEVAGPQVTLESIQQLDEFEVRRLAGTRGPLALHETMPVDQHALFAGLSEAELRKLLPEQSVEEYVRHGGRPTSDDDQFRRMEVDEQGNLVGPDYEGTTQERYQRRLRDYSVEFDELAQRRVVMLADLEAVVKDNERLAAALVSAKQLQAFREDQIRKLGTDLAGVAKEREIIERHLAALEQQLANTRQLVADAVAENVRLADQLAQLQRQWTDLIDERSSAAAAEGPLALSAP
jgi:hypothetical protein